MLVLNLHPQMLGLNRDVGSWPRSWKTAKGMMAKPGCKILRTNSTTCWASGRGSGAVNSKRTTASAPATTPNNIHCKAMFESSSSEQTLMCFLPSPPNLNSVICNTATSGSHIYKIAEKKPNPPKHRDQLQKSIESKFAKDTKPIIHEGVFLLLTTYWDTILDTTHTPYEILLWWSSSTSLVSPTPNKMQTRSRRYSSNVSGSNTVGKHLSGTLYFRVSWPRLCTHTIWSVHVQLFILLLYELGFCIFDIGIF